MAQKTKVRRKDFPTLYAFTSKGEIKQWRAWVVEEQPGTATIYKESGRMNGKLKVEPKEITKGKNIGKANETTPFEQAVSETQSSFNRKLDKKYTEEVPTEDNRPDILLPMLALSYTKRKHDIVYPAYAQPKLNGVRCLAKKVSETDVVYTSRKGKRFETLEHLTPEILKTLEIGEVLDGEIYIHGKSFQQIIRLVKKQRENSTELELWVYDKAEADTPFVDRNKWIQKKVQGSHIRVVETVEVENEDAVYKLHDRFVQDGYEGAIIRNFSAAYKFDHRSKDLQKYKKFIDEEFVIVGGTEGTGSDNGCIVFECETKDGKRFSVRPRGTVAHRKQMFNELDKLIGKELTVRYQELTEDGIPFFPVGIVVRDYE